MQQPQRVARSWAHKGATYRSSVRTGQVTKTSHTCSCRVRNQETSHHHDGAQPPTSQSRNRNLERTGDRHHRTSQQPTTDQPASAGGDQAKAPLQEGTGQQTARNSNHKKSHPFFEPELPSWNPRKQPKNAKNPDEEQKARSSSRQSTSTSTLNPAATTAISAPTLTTCPRLCRWRSRSQRGQRGNS